MVLPKRKAPGVRTMAGRYIPSSLRIYYGDPASLNLVLCYED